VGINAYPAGAKLAGCVADIENFHQFVRQSGFSLVNQRQLRDRQAGYSRMLGAMLDTAMADADKIVLEFSGHGTALEDETGDEFYGIDAAIVPVDFQKTGLITDDQLASWSDLITGRGKKAIVLLDSCYSGYAQRAFDFLTPEFVRKAFHQDKPRALPDHFISTKVFHATRDNIDFSGLPADRKRKAKKAPKPTGEFVNITEGDSVFIETARWNETAADAWIAEKKAYQGAGTTALLAALEQLGKSASYLQVAAAANDWLKARRYSQRIVLEGSNENLNLPFLT